MVQVHHADSVYSMFFILFGNVSETVVLIYASYLFPAEAKVEDESYKKNKEGPRRDETIVREDFVDEFKLVEFPTCVLREGVLSSLSITSYHCFLS